MIMIELYLLLENLKWFRTYRMLKLHRRSENVPRWRRGQFYYYIDENIQRK